MTFLNIGINKCKKKTMVVQTAITIFICSFIDVGYFIKSDLINVDYYQAAIIFEFLVVILCTRHELKLSMSCFRYLVCLLISLILLIIVPSDTANVTGLLIPRFEYYMTGQLPFTHPVFSKFSVFFFIIATCLIFAVDSIRKFFTRDDWLHTMYIVARLGKALLVIVCFEIVIKYIIGSNIYATFIVELFGEGTSTYLTLVDRGSFRMLQGLTREASHFAYGMMLLVILLFTTEKCGKQKNAGWIAISLIALILSGAFSMVLCIAFLAGYYLIVLTYGNNDINKISGRKFAYFILSLSSASALLGIVGITLIQSNGYLSQRLIEALEIVGGLGKNGIDYYASLSYVTSSQSRLYSAYFTFMEFLKRPFWGLGIGTTFCYSPTILTVAEIGLIPFIALWCFFIKIMKKYCLNIMPCRLSLLLWVGINLLSGIQPRLIVAADFLIIIGCCIAYFGSDNIQRSEFGNSGYLIWRSKLND